MAPAVVPGVVEGSSPRFSSAREIADAVFARMNPADVACNLLEGGDAKGGSVKARVWETLLEYKFGRPPAADSAGDPAGRSYVIWDIPAPAREHEPTEEE